MLVKGEFTAEKPLIVGLLGMKAASSLPDFAPESGSGYNYVYRRLPAALRVLNPPLLDALKTTDETQIYAAVRYWIDPERRRVVYRHPGVAAPAHAIDLHDWIVTRGNGALLSWWKKPTAWRSPREFWGYSSTMRRLGLPHVEPFEVANFRLPDDISCDRDVVLFQSWCQGLMLTNFPKGHEAKPGYASSVRRGLEKFSRSPWIRFALAAPYMTGVGVQFGEATYFDSSFRLEYLAKNPFKATDAELEHILASGVFEVAYSRAKHDRKGGKAINPSGGWYVGGSISRALGPHFRRGGQHASKLDV